MVEKLERKKERREADRQTDRKEKIRQKNTFFLKPSSRSLLESSIQDPSHNPLRPYKSHSAAPDVFLSLTIFTAFPHTEVVKRRLIYTRDDKYGGLVTGWVILSCIDWDQSLTGIQRKLLTNAWPMFPNKCCEVKLMCVSDVG